MNRSVTVASALVFSLPGAVAVALADEQSVPATAPIANEAITELEEIVVTASKRSEDVREVPTSISVLTGQQLQESHVVDFGDLSQAVPGLSFSSQAGPGLSTLELRGISSAAGSATVGLYLDEVPVTIRNLLTIGNTEPSFFDLDRIEVLRGPQGTLYGDSSEGGTIRFISIQPDTQVFSTNVHSEISNTEHGGINSTSSLVVNLPLSENQAALRVGVQHTTTSGYIDQVSPVTGGVINSGINSDTTDVIRATLQITPTPALTITPALFFQRTSSADIDAYYLNPYTNPATGATLTLRDLQTAKLVREPGTDTLAVPSVTVKYEGTIADLTSVSSYFYRGFRRTQDGTVGDSVYLGSVLTANGFNGNAIAALPGYIYLNTINRSYTQEIRLASKGKSSVEHPWTWIVGAYASDEKTSVSDYEPIPGLTSTIESLTGQPPQQLPFIGLPFPGDSTYYSLRRYEVKDVAGFGNLGYQLTAALRVSAGVRYQVSDSSIDRVGDDFFNGGYSHDASSSRDHALTPGFNFTYDVNAANTLYGNISKGYRIGGPNRPVPASVCAVDLAGLGLTAAPGSYKADSLWNYELGTKSLFLENRLAVNLDAFYIKWSQIQQDVYLNTCGYDFFQNVGAARSYGSEAEIRAAVGKGVSVAIAGAYTLATFTEAAPSLGVHAGDPVEGAPVWNGSATVEWRGHLTGELQGFTSLNYRGTGNSHGALSNTNPDYLRPSYGSLNASVGVALRQWEFSLFGQNLTNEQKTIQRPNIQSVTEGVTLRPLSIGIAATGRF